MISVYDTGPMISVYDTGRMTLGFWYWAYDSGRVSLGVWSWVYDSELIIRGDDSGVWFWAYDSEHIILGLWFWVYAAKSTILYVWFWVSGARFYMYDFGPMAWASGPRLITWAQGLRIWFESIPRYLPSNCTINNWKYLYIEMPAQFLPPFRHCIQLPQWLSGSLHICIVHSLMHKVNYTTWIPDKRPDEMLHSIGAHKYYWAYIIY